MMTLQEIAAHLYAVNVDVEKGLYHKQVATQCIHAAEAFLERFGEYTEENKPACEGRFLEIIAYLANKGKRISAIKEVRVCTGLGLKEAKDVVDNYSETGQWMPMKINHDAAQRIVEHYSMIPENKW